MLAGTIRPQRPVIALGSYTCAYYKCDTGHNVGHTKWPLLKKNLNNFKICIQYHLTSEDEEVFVYIFTVKVLVTPLTTAVPYFPALFISNFYSRWYISNGFKCWCIIHLVVHLFLADISTWDQRQWINRKVYVWLLSNFVSCIHLKYIFLLSIREKNQVIKCNDSAKIPNFFEYVLSEAVSVCWFHAL